MAEQSGTFKHLLDVNGHPIDSQGNPVRSGPSAGSSANPQMEALEIREREARIRAAELANTEKVKVLNEGRLSKFAKGPMARWLGTAALAVGAVSIFLPDLVKGRVDSMEGSAQSAGTVSKATQHALQAQGEERDMTVNPDGSVGAKVDLGKYGTAFGQARATLAQVGAQKGLTPEQQGCLLKVFDDALVQGTKQGVLSQGKEQLSNFAVAWEAAGSNGLAVCQKQGMDEKLSGAVGKSIFSQQGNFMKQLMSFDIK